MLNVDIIPGSVVQENVTFPQPFDLPEDKAPVVVGCLSGNYQSTAAGFLDSISLSFGNLSRTGFTLFVGCNLASTSVQSVRVSWIAVA